MKLTLPGGRYVLPHNAFDALAGMPAAPPDVSVVIPYFEAQADLDLVLAALAKQTHPLSRLEVLVVDDGSSVAPTLPTAGPLGVRLLRQEPAGFRAAAARNLGAREAEGAVLCFLDGDTIPETTYVAAAARLPALCPDALVVGRRLHGDFSGWSSAAVQAGMFPAELPAPDWLERGYRESRNLLDADNRSFRFVLSAVMTCSTALFQELTGFDESFTSYGGEDWEFAARGYQAGAVLAHEPAARAWHNGPDWAGRGGDPAAKNAETLKLARLITAPGARGRGVAHEYPACLVTIAAEGWTDAALEITVDAALTGVDVGVWLSDTGRVSAAGQVNAGGRVNAGGLFGADPRVRAGQPSPEALRRAQHLVAITSPCVFDPGLPGQVTGRLSVGDEAGTLLTVTNTRAAGRVRRWAHVFPDRDLFSELFGGVPPPARARRIPDEPDLAGWYGGWAYLSGTRSASGEQTP